MIEIKKCSKKFGEICAVNQVSAEIKEGPESVKFS